METKRDVGPNLKSFFYHVCQPENKELVRGSVLVLHGAEGHGGRYGPFGDELAKQGYAMFAVDHIGHGKTIMDDSKALGKWNKEDFDLSTYNAYYLVDVIRKMYPGKPVYLLGDDYGGVMAQYMIGKYEDAFDGIVLSSCGMPTGKDLAMFVKSWIKKVCLYDGGQSKRTFKSRTRFLNRHFRPKRTKYDWLNSVPEEVDRFIEDPLAGYVCTIGYYFYQYKYIISTPRITKLKKVKRDLPILLLGGQDDYITKRGRQIEKLKHYYQRKGFTNVQSIIYNQSRHDVLLEWNKAQVAENIAEFINKNSFKEEVRTTSTKQDDYKVITLKSLQDAVSAEKVIKTVNVELAEEEPEDELRISTKLKD